MQEIQVDPYGIKVMLPKGINHLVRINSVSNIAANILKEEMLSLGAEVAIARGALTGRAKKTDCLLMGNLSQIKSLNKKLDHQPFGLKKIAQDLAESLANYQKNNFIIDLGKFKLNLGNRTLIMGIINLTPDSFSGDGLYSESKFQSKGSRVEAVVDYAEQLVNDGADILDLGGESTRPGARPVSLKEELRRTIPVIKVLAKKIKVPISIDTSKPLVAQAALDNGAVMVNDIRALRDKLMPKIVCRYNCAVVLMHMRGEPLTMQTKTAYTCVLSEVIDFLAARIKRAVDSGVPREKIIVDPGIGFAKTKEQNLEILKGLKELKILGQPILVGPSRKSFIGKILKAEPKQRIFGTIPSCILAIQNGAKIIRAHDVQALRQALKVSDAINNI